MGELIAIYGGAFQSVDGDPVANGILVMQMIPDNTFNEGSPTQLNELCGNIVYSFSLDSNGDVPLTSPATSFVYSNDSMNNIYSYYRCSVYTSKGQLVWGPNNQQVLYYTSPVETSFNLSGWIPNQLNYD